MELKEALDRFCRVGSFFSVLLDCIGWNFQLYNGVRRDHIRVY